MSLFTNYYTWNRKSSTQKDWDGVACFRQAKETYSSYDELYIRIFKKYESHTNNDSILKYDTYDIQSWVGFLNHCKLKCSLYKETDDEYIVLLKKEDYINVNHFLMCCQCIRYLYEKPKTDIPKWAMKLRQQYNLFDPMECLLMAHYINKDLYYSREHSMINGVVKIQDLWKTMNKLETESSLHKCFDYLSDSSLVIYKMNENLINNKIDKIIEYSNEVR